MAGRDSMDNTATDSAQAESRRFGPFALNLRSGELRKNGRLVKLQEQPFQVLAALIERPGEVVTRDELREKVWPANTFVDFYNSLNIAIGKLRQALKDDAAKPRYIETLPRRGYRFIAAVEEVAAVKEPPAEGMPPTETPALPARSRVRQMLTGFAVSAATLMICWAGWVQLVRRTGSASAAVTLRPSAAVLGFKNLAGRPDQNWLSTALAEMLSTELAAGERVRTVPGERVARTKLDLALPDADSFSAETLARIRKNLGADYVVVGSYFDAASGDRLRLDLRLQDTRAGQTVATFSETGGKDDLPNLVSRAGLTLTHKLDVGFLSQAQSEGVRAALPPDPDEARLHAEGLAKLRRFDARGARDLLEQAVATNPQYAPAHAALAGAWSQLGYLELAKQEARKAWDLSGKLPRADRMSIEAGYRETTAEWERAIQIYRQLRDLFPDNADYGLRLAAVEVRGGHAKDALAALEKLRKLPSPSGDDPAIDLMQSRAAEQLGDLQHAQESAAKAAGQSEARGAQMLLAEARSQQCRQLRLLGRLDQARNACQSAREIFARAGDRAGVANTLGYLAAALADQGDLAAARQSYEQALAIDREIGDDGGALWELNGMADLLLAGGDLAGARRLYLEALTTAHRTSSRHDEANALDNVALTSMLEGDLARARTSFETALGEFRQMSDKAGAANVLDNLGVTLYFQGDLGRAAGTLDQAAALDRETGNKGELADVLAWSGRVRLAQGDLEAARKQYNEALRLWSELGSQGYVAQYRLPLADLEIEAGHPNAAEGPIREGLQVFQRDKLRDVEAEARTLLARALLAQGKAAEAGQEIERAAGLVKASQQAAARYEFGTVAARVRAASGKPADVSAAIRSLEAVAADAGRHGFLGHQLKARLALGETELRAGRGEAARALLRTVEKDAQARGFGMIARQAAAARAGTGVHG